MVTLTLYAPFLSPLNACSLPAFVTLIFEPPMLPRLLQEISAPSLIPASLSAKLLFYTSLPDFTPLAVSFAVLISAEEGCEAKMHLDSAIGSELASLLILNLAHVLSS